MSFGSAVRSFAQQAARDRAEAFGTRIRTHTTPARVITVFISPWRVERELGEHGFVETVRAQLRVQTSAAWTPSAGDEFTIVATGEVARINAVSTHPISAEIVCEVVRRNL